MVNDKLIVEAKELDMNFENYTIRLISSLDVQDYFDMVQSNKKRLERFFAGTVSRTKSLEETAVFLKEIEEGIQDKSYFAYLIIDNNTESMMGFLDLKNIDWRVPKSEIGFFIDAHYAGKGITSKALHEFCLYCFSHHGFEKLFLRTHKSNVPARKVAERCGFQIEGTLRRDYRTSSGELVDVLYYGKLR